MKLPDRISEITLHNIYSEAGGYPYPLGFHPFTECASDEGDVFGLYWPVGMEEQPPLVVLRWHDSWDMIPLSSSLEQFLDWCSLVREDDGSKDSRECQPSYPPVSTDPLSPLSQFSNALEARKQDKQNKAIAFLENALHALPEYTAASSLLHNQYRRVGDHDSALRTALKSIISPPSFGWMDDHLVPWLKIQESCPNDVALDPIWTNRNRLIGRYGGTKENENYLVFDEAIQCYVEIGESWKAIVLSITYGELMCRETSSFRARYGFEREMFLPNLRALIRQVGGSSRDL